MSARLPFRRIAILPPAFGPSDDILNWHRAALTAGADAFYLRTRIWPPAQVQAAFEALQAKGARVLLPYAAHLPAPEDAFLHFTEQDPLQPVRGHPCGRSCHSLAAIQAAAKAGFAYAFLSPVFSTSTHPDALPLGLESLREACAAASIPVFALGGVRPENEADCIAAGAAGIAAIGMFWH